MNEETTIFRGSPSVVTRMGQLLLAILILAGSVAGVFLLGQPLLWILAGLALAYMLGVIFVVKAQQYEVTTERVRHRRGLFTKRTDELELYRVTDTTLIEPLSLRLLGLGTIELRTADATCPVMHIEAVHGARGLREQLRKHVEDCRDRKRVRLTEFDQ